MANRCPIALPARVREKLTFTAHGERFQVKQVSRGEFFLARDVESPSRSRWGTRAQICADIDHVMENGALPVPKSGSGF